MANNVIDVVNDWQAVLEISKYTGWSVDDILDMSKTWDYDTYANVLKNSGISYYVRKDGSIATLKSRSVEGISGTTSKTIQSAGVVEANNVTNKASIKPLPETTNTAGETISAGGAKVGVKTAVGAIAVAETIGFFANDWVNHTDWWSDLSDAVFQKNEFEGNSITGKTVDKDYWSLNWCKDVGTVLIRRVTDALGKTSNYKSFMPVNNIASYIQYMLEVNAIRKTEIIPNEEISSIPLGESRIVSEVTYPDFSPSMASSFCHKIGVSQVKSDIDFERLSNLGIGLNAVYMDPKELHPQYPVCMYDINLDDINDGLWVHAYSISLHKEENVEVRNSADGLDGIYAMTKQTVTSYTRFIKRDGTIGQLSVNSHKYPIPSGIYGSFVGAMDSTIITAGSEEIKPLDDALLFEMPEGVTDLGSIIDKMRITYPDWFKKGFKITSYNPITQQNEETEYLPISIPDTDISTGNLPKDYNQPKAQDGTVGDTETQTQTQYIYYIPDINKTGTDYPQPNDTPKPPSIAGGASSNALWAVYNPTKDEVSALGSYLWTDNIIQLIQQFLQNPMDAIISLHMIYCTPIIGAKKEIKLGYLGSGVMANEVTEQYVTIECGSVTIPTYYDDARDYSPYTTIEIFLPFIGIRRLSAEDVIGCTVSVKYVIDVYTGCILCNITVNKNGASQVLYTFSGNCSVQIPLTGADRTRLLSGALSGTLIGLTGGAAGAMGGAVLGGLTSGTSIERSSNFGGNAGAMGIKIPYVIVNRKIGVDATDYNRQYGFPVNTSILLNDCQGYTRVKDVHVENISNATVDEKNEIERLLKSGVIIS